MTMEQLYALVCYLDKKAYDAEVAPTTLEPLPFRPVAVQSDIPTITVRAMMLNRARFKAAAITAKWLCGLPLRRAL